MTLLPIILCLVHIGCEVKQILRNGQTKESKNSILLMITRRSHRHPSSGICGWFPCWPPASVGNTCPSECENGRCDSALWGDTIHEPPHVQHKQAVHRNSCLAPHSSVVQKSRVWLITIHINLEDWIIICIFASLIIITAWGRLFRTNNDAISDWNR